MIHMGKDCYFCSDRKINFAKVTTVFVINS